ncbi:MAG: TonB-dependent receptor [Gammaproteobacteria bacterium]|nr:MAG: TonB-dependent receptor [Gammaproteobacteria bacterium]
MSLKKTLISAACAAMAGAAVPSQAASWTMMEGAEPPDSTHKLFGAVQIVYENHFGCERMDGLQGATTHALNNGLFNNQCRSGPELRDQKADFYVPNLMVGARGNFLPGRVNYFVTLNAGDNLANYKTFKTSREHTATFTDASVTLSYIPGVRVRLGRFKKPGPEELYQGLDATDYIFMTDFVNRVQVERFIEGNAKGTAAISGQGYSGNIKKYADDADVGRDTGVQFFDAFKRDKWTHSYAVMLAEGEGVHGFDLNSGHDTNLYWASEYDLPGGKGALKHGVKLFGWHQSGKRNFIIDSAGTKSQDFDKIRYGIGAKALGPIFGENRGIHRLGFELMYAEGMIFHTPAGNISDAPFGGWVQVAAERENQSRGITLDYGYYLNKHWQFDARWSRHDLLYKSLGTSTWGPADRRELEFLTLGATYHFTPDTRLTFNYEYRHVTAPDQTTSTAANANNAYVVTGSVGDHLGLRLTHKF